MRAVTRFWVKSGALALSVFLLAPAAFTPPARAAANDACALVGALDARAKALCQAAASTARPAAAPARPATQAAPAPAPAPATAARGPAPPPPPAGPVPAGFTRVNFIGNLYVDVEGAYPQGYSGKYDNLRTVVRTAATQTAPNGRVTLGSLRVAMDDDMTTHRALFAFDNGAGSLCIADLTGTDAPVLITATPRTFRGTDLYLAKTNARGSTQCAASTTANTYLMDVTFSADRAGNITMSYVEDVKTIAGAQTGHRESEPYVFKNQMSPAMAAADLVKKNAAQAVADQAAAAQRAQAAQDAADKQRSLSVLDALEKGEN